MIESEASNPPPGARQDLGTQPCYEALGDLWVETE